MITGAHSIIYSANADADRDFLRDVLKLPSIDVGGGWLIFGLPPAEVALHPADKNDVHELYLMTDDVNRLIAELQSRGVTTSEVQDQGWGLLTQIALPGGGKLAVYEPRHPRPEPAEAPTIPAPPKLPKKRAAKKKKTPAKSAPRAPKIAPKTKAKTKKR